MQQQLMSKSVNHVKEKKESSTSLWSVYVWTLSFLKPYWVMLLFFLLTISIQSSAELVIPKFIQFFVDRIYIQKDWQLFNLFMLILAGVIVIVIVAGLAHNLLSRHIREKAARDLQFSIFEHLRTMGFAYYERNPIGQTLALLNTEVAALQSLYRESFPLLVEGVIFTLISFVMMSITSIQLTAAILPVLLLYYVLGPYLNRQASKYAKLLSESRVNENQKIYESLSSLPELRVFAAETWDLKRFMVLVKKFNSNMIRAYFYGYMRAANRQLTYFIGAIVIFIYGYYLLVHDEILVGELVSFILLYFFAVQKLSVVLINLTAQKVLMIQAENLYHFVHLTPEVVEDPNPVRLAEVEGRIEFDHVTFGYSSEQPILENFSLTIEPGQHVAFVGFSGNGKSTLLKLIGRFYDPQEGRILLDQVPIDKLSLADLRQSLGYVFQETYMFGATIRENIHFGNPDASEEEIIGAAKAAHAHDFISRLPDGYDTVVGERGIKLSGGQKQRISIARMMLLNPKIIILDEATSALDTASEAIVQQAFQTLLNGRTVVAVAHRLSTIKDFDKIVFINHGKIVESGTYSELMDARQSFFSLATGHELEGKS